MAPASSSPGIQERHRALLAQGRFCIQHCTACGRHVYFPRALCPHCGAEEPPLVEPAGTGTVYAVTTVRRKPADGGDYNVSVVELDEGVRLMSRVENLAPDAVRIGLRVKARVRAEEALVVFDPLEGGA